MSMEELRRFVFQFFNENKDILENHYPGITGQRLCQEILDLPHFGRTPSFEILSQPYIPFTHNPLTEFFEQLKEGRPLAHIHGRTSFYGHTFQTSPGVFIPRQETELLVERGISELKRLQRKGLPKEDDFLWVADVGLGTGCVLLSTLIGLGGKCAGVGIDINPMALELAERNAFCLKYKMHPETKVKFLLGDRFFNLKTRFHMILSNPPYIHRHKDDPFVHWAARKYDPHEALYLEDEIYWEWFEVLFTQTLELLCEGGVFIMEGHEFHLEELARVAKRLGFAHVELLPDLTHRWRFLLGHK